MHIILFSSWPSNLYIQSALILVIHKCCVIAGAAQANDDILDALIKFDVLINLLDYSIATTLSPRTFTFKVVSLAM